jgi:hypothetical protein
LWRCGDGLFFEVLPLASDALLTTLHSLLGKVLQTISRKLQEDSGSGGCFAILKRVLFKTTITLTTVLEA